MTEPDLVGGKAQSRGVGEDAAQRAFARYFAQLTAVSLAIEDLRAAYNASLWEDFFAKSVNCAWGVLEARRTMLETVTGHGSWSRPGYRYIRDQLRDVLREGWYYVAHKPDRGDALALQLRVLEDRLTRNPDSESRWLIG